MKVSLFLPVASAALAAAIVIPDGNIISQVVIEGRPRQAPVTSDDKHVSYHGDSTGGLHPEYLLGRRYRSGVSVGVPRVDADVFEGLSQAIWENAHRGLNPAFFHRMYRHLASECPAHDQAEGGGDNPQWPEPPEPPEPPSWPPKPPGDEPRPRPPAHPGKPPGHPQHPPPHHSRPHIHNETIWQLISKSNYTKKFAEYVAEFEDLVTLLNSTVANYTVFVPTDRAFDNVEKHIHNKHPSKEKIKQALTYHITNEPFPIFKLLLSHTIPSALHSDQLGGPQRLRIGLGPHGFAVNFYSHIVAGNIFASNGVIHGVDNILIPPPDVEVILSLFPTQFSTFSLAAHLTNLKADLPAVTRGGTLFAPPNSAWERLPRKVNAFLFSPFGRKYLKALLQYHVVLNETLYSDAYYHPIAQEGEVQSLPKGQYHVDLPTLLEGKHLSIDISRFGGFINIVINGQSVVRVQDGIARNGVIQVVKNVLIPPRKPPADPVEAARREMEDIEIQHGIGEMTLEDFKSRFEGLLED